MAPPSEEEVSLKPWVSSPPRRVCDPPLAMASSSASQASVDEEAVVRKFEAMRSGVESIWRKINELEMEKHEHGLVLEALDPLDRGRKCFRMIGSVLVERTVGEVMPAVQRNREGIEQVRPSDSSRSVSVAKGNVKGKGNVSCGMHSLARWFQLWLEICLFDSPRAGSLK